MHKAMGSILSLPKEREAGKERGRQGKKERGREGGRKSSNAK
jgi:hypothetical protein